jgi:hypothetical protein
MPLPASLLVDWTTRRIQESKLQLTLVTPCWYLRQLSLLFVPPLCTALLRFALGNTRIVFVGFILVSRSGVGVSFRLDERRNRTQISIFLQCCLHHMTLPRYDRLRIQQKSLRLQCCYNSIFHQQFVQFPDSRISIRQSVRIKGY